LEIPKVSFSSTGSRASRWPISSSAVNNRNTFLSVTALPTYYNSCIFMSTTFCIDVSGIYCYLSQPPSGIVRSLLAWLPSYSGQCLWHGWGTMLQARRSWVQFLIRSLDFSVDIILPATLWSCVDSASNRNEYQESSWQLCGALMGSFNKHFSVHSAYWPRPGISPPPFLLWVCQTKTCIYINTLPPYSLQPWIWRQLPTFT
jgi:hypothetical protein